MDKHTIALFILAVLLVPMSPLGGTYVDCGTGLSVPIPAGTQGHGQGSTPNAAKESFANSLGVFCAECPANLATPICTMSFPPGWLNKGGGSWLLGIKPDGTYFMDVMFGSGGGSITVECSACP